MLSAMTVFMMLVTIINSKNPTTKITHFWFLATRYFIIKERRLSDQTHFLFPVCALALAN